jgi:hypothetical protein
MKLFGVAALALVSGQEDYGWEDHDVVEEIGARGLMRADNRGPAERRSDDLLEMINYYFKAEKNNGGANIKFDANKYWAYGCHCLSMTDRVLSSMGHGKPVDALDRACRQYKECQKCAFEAHPTDNAGTDGEGRGEYGCIGEAVQYSWRKVGNKEHPNYPHMESKDINNSCQRDLFLCDAQFAIESTNQVIAGVWNTDFSAYYTTTGFDADTEQSCPKNAGNGSRECCGGWDANMRPWFLFNQQSHQCHVGEALEIGSV